MTPTCSRRSADLEEEIWGTAPEEPGFLVLENPGPWGRDGLADSRLDGGTAAAIAAAAKAAGLRLQAIRRSTRRYNAAPVHAWIGRFGGPMERLELPHARSVLDLDLAGAAAGRLTGAGVADDSPLFLVCTHSTRDPCCARLGLPLAREVGVAAGGRTWHSSHLGGHRFAATMAVLPSGLWLGRVPVTAAAAVVAAAAAGEVPYEYLRGRAGLACRAQVAEIELRRRHGLRDGGALRVLSADGDAITLEAAGERVALTVVREPTGTARPLSCGAGAKVEDPGRYRISASPGRP